LPVVGGVQSPVVVTTPQLVFGTANLVETVPVLLVGLPIIRLSSRRGRASLKCKKNFHGQGSIRSWVQTLAAWGLIALPIAPPIGGCPLYPPPTTPQPLWASGLRPFEPCC